MVDFALSVSLLAPAMIGVFQLGQAMFEYNRLQSAVRAAARYASMRSYDSTTSTPTAAFQTAVRNLVIYGTPAGGGSSNFAGIAPDHVHLAVTMNAALPSVMTVSINGYSVDTIFGDLTFNNKPSASFAYGGRYTAGY
jgi:Flp pilus assembly protein TadG